MLFLGAQRTYRRPCYENVCPTVCHTRDPRLNGIRYRNMLCTYRRKMSLVSPGPISQSWIKWLTLNKCVKQRHPVDSENLTNNPRYLNGNGARYLKIGCVSWSQISCIGVAYELSIGIESCDLKWHWTRNGSYFALFHRIRGYLRPNYGKVIEIRLILSATKMYSLKNLWFTQSRL